MKDVYRTEKDLLIDRVRQDPREDKRVKELELELSMIADKMKRDSAVSTTLSPYSRASRMFKAAGGVIAYGDRLVNATGFTVIRSTARQNGHSCWTA
jgi:hypothetical protein